MVPFSVVTNNMSWAIANACAGALIAKGDPGTGASEPSLWILNALITGASDSPRKRNSAEIVADIGVGVGVGVGVVPGVGVGVGEGFTFATRRGEITQPPMTRRRQIAAMVIANGYGRLGKCRI